jgi:hypothetical protein
MLVGEFSLDKKEFRSSSGVDILDKCDWGENGSF